MESGDGNLNQISNVVTINQNNITTVTASSLANLNIGIPAVGVPVSGSAAIPGLAIYNCGDNVGQLISGQAVQVELSANDFARQFNQQLGSQYPIQVQLVQPNGHGGQAQQIIPIQIHQPGPSNQNQQIQIQGGQQIQIQSMAQHVQQQIPFTTTSIATSLNDKDKNIMKTNTSVDSIIEMKKPRSKLMAGERVICHVCNKSVSCAATLRDHLRTHTGERPFKCPECPLSFSQRSNLRMHKRLHTGERPYMCGICGKTFARSSHLPAHMGTHTGEKPYQCQECDHSFITAQQLKNHHRVHTGEKPWKCDLCDAAFTHSSSLSTHKKKHTGHKPFACEVCGKKFFFTSALEKHLKVHSKHRPFACPNCDHTFKYKESLTVHMGRYCGRNTDKKPRAKKPDAKRPGSKVGTGRKYVQQKKTRPRGRPKKKGSWSKRSSRKVMDDIPEQDSSPMKSEDSGSETYPQESLLNTSDDGRIPEAELKVEVGLSQDCENSNGQHVVVNSLSDESVVINNSNIQFQPQIQSYQLTQQQILDSSHGSNVLQLDPSTQNITMLPPEEAEKYISSSGGNVQVVTVRPEMLQQQFVDNNMQMISNGQVVRNGEILSSQQLQQLRQIHPTDSMHSMGNKDSMQMYCQQR